MAAKKCLDIHSLDEADGYARQALDLLELNAICANDLAVADVMANHIHILYEKSAFLEIKRVAQRYMPQLEGNGRYRSACLRHVLSRTRIGRLQ